jgi:NAD(P)-dependent dehydrogenase (short-subunit alcohol dehydrogenase family)
MTSPPTERQIRRRALVTGGAVRVGRAIALALAAAGFDVAIAFHRSTAAARGTVRDVERLGGRAHAVRADLRDARAARPLVARAVRALGGLDVLVNSAGVFRRVDVEDLNEEWLDEAYDVNVKAAVMAARAAAPHMLRRGGGAIVNVASVGGLRPWKAYLPYCASKAALVMATRCLALALAPEIRVNAVAPGILDPPGAPAELRGRIPLGRFGEHAEAVRATLYLAGEASYTTGEVLTVDGGRALA